TAEIERIVAESLDSQRLRSRMQQIHDALWNPRLFCNVLTIYLLIAVPLIAWRVGLAQNWPWIIANVFLCWIAAVAVFRQAHRKLQPEAHRERRKHTFLMSVLPLEAMRACDVLLRDALVAFHPLAIVHALCDRRTFVEFAQKLLLDLRYPAPSE